MSGDDSHTNFKLPESLSGMNSAETHPILNSAESTSSSQFTFETSDYTLIDARKRIDWTPFYLEFDALQRRLGRVKKDFGLRKAISTRSLRGETRTLAEILDKEVEKIVLFFLKIQGELADRAWQLRERQVKLLNGDSIVTVDQIDVLCQNYRDLGYEVLELLEYLDFNVTGLRRVIKRHDKLFDLKMGRIYFDSRLAGGDSKNSQLLQLYHQEGLRAIIGAVRKGFYELHDAKEDLSNIKIVQQNLRRANVPHLAGGNFNQGYASPDRTSSTSAKSVSPGGRYGGVREEVFAPALTRINSSGILNAGVGDNNNDPKFLIPRSSYISRLSASNSMPQLAGMEKVIQHQIQHQEAAPYQSLSPAADNKSNSFTKWLGIGETSRVSLHRSLSDLEPVLRRISETQDRVTQSQKQTTSEYLATHSIMALERYATDEDDDDEEGGFLPHFETRTTSKLGLFLNLLVSFLFMTNHYVVAPTSGQYSALLGQSEAMSGMIIGLSPSAAFISGAVYSYWTNTSFKQPMLAAVTLLVVGNLLYAMALQCDSYVMLFLGRFLCGLGAPRGVARRYISDHVETIHRTVASSHFVSASALGLAFGPLLSVMITLANLSYSVKVNDVVLVKFTPVTAPGWIMFILWIITWFAVLIGFTEPLTTTDRERSDTLFGAVMKAVNGAYIRVNSGWNQMLSNPRLNILSENGSDGNGDYSAISSQSLHENVVSIELGDILVDQSTTLTRGEKERSSSLHSTGSIDGEGGILLEGHSPQQTLYSSRSALEKSSSNSTNTQSTGSTVEALHSTSNEKLDVKVEGANQDNKDSNMPSSHLTSLQQPDMNSNMNEDTDKNVYYQQHEGVQGDEESYYIQSNQMLRGMLHRASPQWIWDYINFEITITLCIYFINKIGQEMVVSSVPTLTTKMFSWDTDNAGFFMALMGALVLPANIFISSFKEAEDRYITYIISFFIIFSICIILDLEVVGDYTPFQYCVGASTLFALLNAQEGIIMALLSRLVPPEMAKGTLNSGFLATEVGTLGRVMSDLSITMVSSGTIDNPTDMVNWLFSPLGVAFALVLTTFSLYYENFSI